VPLAIKFGGVRWRDRGGDLREFIFGNETTEPDPKSLRGHYAARKIRNIKRCRPDRCNS
jgi:hypothetical protein